MQIITCYHDHRGVAVHISLCLVLVSLLLLFGPICLLSLDARIVGSFFERVPLCKIACIAALIVTRGASAQRLAFVMCIFFVLQLLPGVSAMDGDILPSEANGGSNEPAYERCSFGKVSYLFRLVAGTQSFDRVLVQSYTSVGGDGNRRLG